MIHEPTKLLDDITYSVGPAEGLSRTLFAPNGQPWCRFRSGPLECTNERRCRNPRHRITDPAAVVRILMALSDRWGDG